MPAQYMLDGYEKAIVPILIGTNRQHTISFIHPTLLAFVISAKLKKLMRVCNMQYDNCFRHAYIKCMGAVTSGSLSPGGQPRLCSRVYYYCMLAIDGSNDDDIVDHCAIIQLNSISFELCMCCCCVCNFTQCSRASNVDWGKMHDDCQLNAFSSSTFRFVFSQCLLHSAWLHVAGTMHNGRWQW